MICDGLHMHLGPAAPEHDPRVLSLTVVRMDQDRHMAVLSDLTQQVAQARRLQESETWFTAMVQGADDYAILGLDADGRVCEWNLSGERLFGHVSNEVVGKYAAEVVGCGASNRATFGKRLGRQPATASISMRAGGGAQTEPASRAHA